MNPFRVVAQFTAGNVVVLQAGDGQNALANTGNPILLKEFTPAGGNPVSTVTVPSTGGTPLIISGSAASEGMMTRSADGHLLVFPGYAVALPNSTPLANANANSINRGIGTVNASGTFTRVTTSNSLHSTNNIRGAASDGLNNYWSSGGNDGTDYFGTASAVATVQNIKTNTRQVAIFNGNLYFSTQSTGGTPANIGIYQVGTGLPVSSGQSITNTINTTASGLPAGFAFNPAGTVCYVADGRAVGSGGGIQKWTFNGSSWTLAYTFGTGTGSTVGAFGLAADFSGASPVLYATTTESSANRLIKVTDTGSNAPVTVLFTAGANIALKGVALAPVACSPISAAISGSGSFCGSGSFNFSVTITGGSGPYTVVYTDGNSIFQVNNYASGATITRSVSASTNFTLVSVTDATNCTATTLSGTASATVNPSVSATPSIIQPTTCVSADGAISLNVTGGGGSPAFSWAGPNVNASTQNQTGLTIGTYSVTITATSGCVFSGSYNLTGPGNCSVCPTIGATSTTPAGSVCPNATFSLSATGLSGMGNTYGIKFVAFNAATADPYNGGTPLASVLNNALTDGGTTAATSASLAAAGAYFIYAILTPTPLDAGCRPAAVTNLTVNSFPAATLLAAPGAIGLGEMVALSVPDAGPGANYTWAGNGVVNANAASTTATPTAYGSQVYSVTVTNACSATGSATVVVNPTVTLSVSANSGSEANATAITVTATASAAVAGNQTVALAVTGAGITGGDYYLSNTTITILSGQTAGSVTFTIADDAITEGAEIAVLTISTPSSGIAIGNPNSQNVTISDNTCSFLRKIGGYASSNGAEIPAFDPASSRLYTVAGPVVEAFTVSNTGSLSLIGSLPLGFSTPAGVTVVPNSVAVKNGILAASFALVTTATGAQNPGKVAFYQASTGNFLNVVTVGYLPDMVTFTPDGLKALSADEGEPNSYGQGNSFDPEGSVSIIDLSAGVANATVQIAGFTAFNSQINTLKAAGVRIYGPGATVAQDLEPEYIALSEDGSTAFVTLQENNALAVVNVATATVNNILPLGLKNHNLPGNGFDASDRDLTGSSGKINIQNWPVFGMYQPDAIAGFNAGGQRYYITANEGDSRAYTGFSEEVRVGASNYVLDPVAFPNAATLKQNANLGRLQLTNATGDTDNDGDIDQIQAFGARSFSIWNASANQIFDSGDQLEQITALRSPTLFNSEGTAATFDTRSDNKGPEPEGLAVGVINNIPYVFVGMERVGDIMVYDVSNPASPVFVQYINVPEDLAVEGLVFVSAANSPTGKPLLITAAEVSATVSVYEIGIPAIAIQVSETSGTANDGVVCAGTNVLLTASGGSSYAWSNLENTATATVSPSVSTAYTVTVTNASGCSATASASITANPLPTPSISVAETSGTANDDGATCAGANVLLTALGGGTSYAWTTLETTASITVSPLNTTTYTVTVTNAYGCAASASKTILANPLPVCSITGPTSVCSSSTSLYAAPAGMSAYAWSVAGNASMSTPGTGSSVSILAGGAAGTFTVSVTVTNANGCTSACSQPVTISGACPVTISGTIRWEHNNAGVNAATVSTTGAFNGTAVTNVNGFYTNTWAGGGNFTLTPTKNTGLLTGLTSADATAVQQHVAGVAPLPGPYKRIAADVNRNNSITTADASLISQVLLGNPAALAIFNVSWRFVPASYVFPNPNVPWGFPEKITLSGVTTDQPNQDFVGVKVGDVNGSGNPATLAPLSPLVFITDDQVLAQGETAVLTFKADNFNDVAAYQMALDFDPSQLQFDGLEVLPGILNLGADNFGLANIAEGDFRTVWTVAKGLSLPQGTPLFQLRLRAAADQVKLSEAIQLNETALEPLAFNTALAQGSVKLVFNETTGTSGHPDATRVQLLQNKPNPFADQTVVAFILPAASDAQIRILDATGKLIEERKKWYAAGYQEENFDLKAASSTGLLYYELILPSGTQTKKMIRTGR